MSFERASDLDMEPCNKVGGCPHKRSVPKNGVRSICDWCMADLSKGTGEI